jgi:hypothetical protein
MNKEIETILDFYPEQNFLLADGFDDAIIGVYGSKLVYSITKCLDILISRDKMSKDEAYEYFIFNVGDAYVGENTPIWVDDLMFN